MLHKLKLSPLGHTWILDLDGTIVKHNGYLLDGHDTLLDGAVKFLNSIPEADMIVFITSRPEDCRKMTERFLRDNDIRFDHIIYNAPNGERILINDMKPSGLKTAISINAKRDEFAISSFEIDDKL
jgi:ribonucleotide monophosphatase NagD (HAD superfamily)